MRRRSHTLAREAILTMTADPAAQRGRPARRILTVLATTLAGAALAPAVAQAGTYTMNACNVPGAPTGTRGPWVIEPNANPAGASNLRPYDSCAAGGSFGLQLPSGAMGAGSTGTVELTPADPGIRVTGVRTWFSTSLGSGPGSPATTVVTSDGATLASFGDPGGTRSPLASASPVSSSFRLSTSCGNTAGQPCYLHLHPLTIGGIEVTLAESAAPTVSVTGGTLTAPGAKSGVHTVVRAGEDQHSGVEKLEVTLDDKVVGTVDYSRDFTRPLGDQKAGTCESAHWNACPKTQSHTFSVSTRFVPDGTYTLGLRATDAAGNVRTATAQTVTIDNVPEPAPAAAPAPVVVAPVAAAGAAGAAGPAGAPGPAGPSGAHPGPVLVVNGVNGSPAATITAAFTAHRRASIRTAYGRSVVIAGRLVAPGGAPVTGARVHVLQQDRLVGSGMVPAGEVVTDADGRFRYATTATRSRLIRFAYRATVGDTAIADTTDVGLAVVAKVSLKRDRASLRNGEVVRFSGAVAGAPRGARKVIELQVKKGDRWMTFRSTRLRDGRFAERYRFRNTRSRQRYVFRARVRQEAGFPFATGVSAAVRVTVRG
jgi:hypothetical protein